SACWTSAWTSWTRNRVTARPSAGRLSTRTAGTSSSGAATTARIPPSTLTVGDSASFGMSRGIEMRQAGWLAGWLAGWIADKMCC
ncbi:hypothetical protein CH063_10141, partial [Colletotrichum higginsianum]